jgi:serine/threonine protein kinase
VIAPGLRIGGHYLIEKRLGAGGMGEVFRAFDEKLERPVAIKVLPQVMASNEDARARMLREARAASALVHPGIVTVHEVDEHEGQIFLVMEYVEGPTFSQVIQKRGKLPPGEALKLIRPVANALEFAHKQGFVHRDIKCSNLMVTNEGHVKVLDFGLSKRITRRDGSPVDQAAADAAADAPNTVGIRKGVAARLAQAAGEVAAAPADAATQQGSGVLAGRPPSMPSHDVDATGPTEASLQRQRKPPANDDLTVEGSAMGTPGYTALELMEGLEADARADVYSLGIVLYELLCATRPFTGMTFAQVHDDVAKERYRRAKELVPSLSSELDNVIVQALRANRDDRTPSVTAMLAGLAEASAAPKRRRRALWVIAGALAVSGSAWGVLQVSKKGATRATRDGAVAVLGPDGDGGVGDGGDGDGGLATGPHAPVRMTQLGGCAYAPAFLDDDTVAFDLTLPGAAPDIHTLAMSTGATQQLTDKPTWEWRAAPGGKLGEIVYLVNDMTNTANSALVARELAGGDARTIVSGPMLAAAAARGAYYYIPSSGNELRSIQEKIDKLVARLAGMAPQALSASRDNQWLAIVGKTPSHSADVCLVSLDTRALRCLDLVDTLAARADFGITGTLYYAANDGIHARYPADGSASADRIAMAGVQAHGGIAISPDGRALVFSACAPASSLRDVSATPQVEVTSEPSVSHPVVGPHKLVAWVTNGNVVSVRLPDGEVGHTGGGGAQGDEVANPSFDAAGDTIVFARTGDEPGIVSVDLAEGAEPKRLTSQPGDDTPLFLNDGSIVFTRMMGANPFIYRIAPGADPARARAEPRRAIDVDRKTGRVLLRVPGAAQLVWWDPSTNAEQPGPPASVPGFDQVRDISLSPDGSWILYQVGPTGGELWRASLVDGTPAGQVYVAQIGTTPGLSAITDEGHPLIVEVAWQGELWRLDAGDEAW